jgi:hypothetical protein
VVKGWRGCVDDGGGSWLVSGGLGKIRKSKTRHDTVSRSRDSPRYALSHIHPSSENDQGPHPCRGEGRTQRKSVVGHELVARVNVWWWKERRMNQNQLLQRLMIYLNSASTFENRLRSQH